MSATMAINDMGQPVSQVIPMAWKFAWETTVLPLNARAPVLFEVHIPVAT